MDCEVTSPKAVIVSSTQELQALFELEQAAFFCGDALDFISALPKASVDLIVTSPPYALGMPYEKRQTLADFVELHRLLIPMCIAALKPGGHLCWQVGTHLIGGSIEPLDYSVHKVVKRSREMFLRNRIVWTFGHGAHAKKRFSGRHETILWYSKGEEYYFDLDSVRVPQRYPSKKHYKGPKKGEYSGNPLGKNPGDVWDIPNVKAKHMEKTGHPCQFPVALVQRLIRSLTKPGDIVVDPFMGSGSTAVAAKVEGRKCIGSDLNRSYLKIAKKRFDSVTLDDGSYRSIDQPPYEPTPSDPIAVPEHFRLRRAERSKR